MKKKTIICRVLSILFCVTILIGASTPEVSATSMYSSSITSESIREKENQIAQAQRDKENLQSGLTDLKALKRELESKRTNLKNYVAELDSALSQIEENIADLERQIGEKEEEIILTQGELEDAQERESAQKDSMVAYIRFVYEVGTPQPLDILLTATSFSDFLNKADYVEKVISYEQMMWQNYKVTREYVELCMKQLELEKDILDQTKVNVEAEQKNLEDLIDQKTRDIISYETDIKTKAQAIKELEEEIQAQEEEISSLEAAIADEKRRILASNGSILTYDNGPFKFPLASYTRISDEYGMRMHPILGVEQFHNGIDFAAPKGTAIYAAYDGKVVAAEYNASMGNYVMIDHGSGLFTIYMHASALYVKKNDIVIRGETIAAVGSTGNSTGNHLHFSVRLNGAYVSPWNYLKE
ncbi:MAG: peptidoglycan DD-metalloendopeptidase family protein [Acetatifactor sp.]|nr:peptidoglycan DD-metalloendopeptidase family protein [Acetatifactor sp.]